MRDRRNNLAKLNTLVFGRDLRITKGEPYPHIYEYDYSSYYPEENYIYNQDLPEDKEIFDISDVAVSNCRFFMTDIYPGTVSGIAIESADGASVHHIKVQNISMNRVTCPVFIRLCNRNRASTVDSSSANAVEFGKRKKRASSLVATVGRSHPYV